MDRRKYLYVLALALKPLQCSFALLLPVFLCQRSGLAELEVGSKSFLCLCDEGPTLGDALAEHNDCSEAVPSGRCRKKLH